MVRLHPEQCLDGGRRPFSSASRVMNQGTNLQIEGIEFCSQKDSKKQNDSQVVAEGCRALPLERRPIMRGELTDDAFRL